MADSYEVALANDLTQKQYLGMFDCQVEDVGEDFARALFRNQQFQTDKITWDELKNQYVNFKPTILCDPCATVPVLDMSMLFKRHEVTSINLKSMIAITCGEVTREMRQIQPGAFGNQITSPEEALRAIINRKALYQARGFDENERDIAWEMLVTQAVKIPESDYLPDGAQLYFPRDPELDVETDQKFGKGQCDTMKIVKNWLQVLDCHDSGARVTDILMHWETAEDFVNGDDMKECLKSYNPQLFLNNQLISEATNRELIRPRGVTLFYTSPEGIRFWKVNAKKRFCDEEGNTKKYDLFPKDYLLGLDLSGSDCSYRPVFGYTPITDLVHLTGGGTQIQTAFTSRYVKNTVTFDPGGWKQVMQSSMLPFLPYADSSTSLSLCKPKNEETFTAPVTKATSKAATKDK